MLHTDGRTIQIHDTFSFVLWWGVVTLYRGCTGRLFALVGLSPSGCDYLPAYRARVAAVLSHALAYKVTCSLHGITPAMEPALGRRPAPES